ncbi:MULTISPECIES: diguanylate cyclase domain-containing protein [Oscillatoriales]|uniref:Response regulator receiver modulated diguanylate cyclase n=1 Tax=Limnospira maxima CS-328 TaxID=513049 RepID=B5VVN4_LIMMA|nr:MULTISPECIES: diguanylate cyclase [Oscillatoriales]EDZ96652.1 response regulator receiver modulated diguanylate cyclase [Limnospira maxima CS-328]MBD2573859.1 diguanylate cyclase [Arthrospira platensis FACHB-971]MBD2710607.1 diguanylate cyclase [Arthrospira platensis FACHB-835]MDC0839472.1 diguanylate cyclase [Limnoraphis robusta]
MNQLMEDRSKILWIAGNVGNDNHSLPQSILQNNGYEVHLVIGLKPAYNAIQSWPFNLILLDSKLHDGDSYELCNWLKSKAKFQKIPVIIMESRGDLLNKHTVFDVGAADYLTQPFHEQEMLKRIGYQITLQRQKHQIKEQDLGLNFESHKSEIAKLALEKQRALLRMVIDANPNLIFIKDWDGRFTLANRATANLYETTVDNMMGKTHSDLNHKQYKNDYILASDREIMTSGKPRLIAAEPVRLNNGEVRWFQANKIPLIGNDGQTPYLLVVSTDITERQEAEQELWSHAERERMLRAIVQSLHECIDLEQVLECTVNQIREFLVSDRALIYRLENDGNYRVVMESVSPPWKPLLGTTINYSGLSEVITEMAAANYLKIWSISNVDKANIPINLRNELDELQVKSKLILPIIHRHPDLRSQETEYPNCLWGLLVIHQCDNTRGWQPEEIEALRSIATPIAVAIQQGELHAKLQTVNQELERLASLDGLTGVANRRQFDLHLKREWQRLLRETAPISVIMCDVDFFKAYNDTYGHQMGDECLKQIAKILENCAQRSTDLASRYGGEEFVIVLPNTGIKGALQVADKIQHQIRALEIEHQKSEVSGYVTLSLGVACQVPNHDRSPESLIKLADAALYEAKSKGRNCIIANAETI